MRGRIFRREFKNKAGEIVQSKSWTIIVDISTAGYKNRKQLRRTVKGTKADAEKELRTILTSVDNGAYVKSNNQTVGQYLEEWLQNYASVNVRPRTYQRYQGIMRNHLIPSLGNITLTQLQPTNIQACYKKSLSGRLDGKPGTITAKTLLQHHRVLTQALSHALKFGLISRNAAKLVTPPKAIEKEMRALDFAEVDKFLEAARDTEYYPLFHLSVYSGLRRSELLGLTWRSIDFNSSQLYITQTVQQLKGGKVAFFEPKTAKSRRSIYLTPVSQLVLKSHREKQEAIRCDLGTVLLESDLVFSNPRTGLPLKPDTITRAFLRIARSVGLHGVRFHDLRHTHATLMLKANVHPKIVSERLGHATVGITLDIYSHVTPGLQEAAARKFDEAFIEAHVDSKCVQGNRAQ